MIDQKNTLIVEQDSERNVRFNPKFRNKYDLLKALENLSDFDIDNIPFAKEKENIVKIFEFVFDHRNFTGRSGTMFSYEGIGSIYWHMVSKLLLAIQENYFFAKNNSSFDKENIQGLGDYYYKVRKGLSAAKRQKSMGHSLLTPYFTLLPFRCATAGNDGTG